MVVVDDVVGGRLVDGVENGDRFFRGVVKPKRRSEVVRKVTKVMEEVRTNGGEGDVVWKKSDDVCYR